MDNIGLYIDLFLTLICLNITWIGYRAIKSKRIRNGINNSFIEGPEAVKRGKLLFYSGLAVVLINLLRLLVVIF